MTPPTQQALAFAAPPLNANRHCRGAV